MLFCCLLCSFPVDLEREEQLNTAVGSQLPEARLSTLPRKLVNKSLKKWLWLKMKELGHTAGFFLGFHLPGFVFVHRFFEAQPNAVEGSSTLSLTLHSLAECEECGWRYIDEAQQAYDSLLA